MVKKTLSDLLDEEEERRNNGNWVPACNRTEVPFFTRSGRKLLYVYQPSSGKHAYLDTGMDRILTDEEAWEALNKG